MLGIKNKKTQWTIKDIDLNLKQQAQIQAKKANKNVNDYVEEILKKEVFLHMQKKSIKDINDLDGIKNRVKYFSTRLNRLEKLLPSN